MKQILIIWVLLSFAAPFAAFGQSLSFTSKDPSKPIQVTADQGIEWQQTDKRFIARGNAKATQGDMNVTADELTAHYRETKSGATEVYRVDAIGRVTIASKDETAAGAAAVYDFDKEVLVIEGSPVTLSTPTGKVTAQQAIQYWSKERVAVAEGDAEAQDETRRIKADKLTAFFAEAKPGADKSTSDKSSLRQGDIRLVVANGNVLLRTEKETARGDRGEYNRETGIAKLEGKVSLTQGQNQVQGGFAVIDTKAGTSRLFGSAAEAKTSSPGNNARVKALIAPKPQATPTPSQWASPAKKDAEKR
jgi:lipopolysaccharide export system protein LptA